MEPKKIQILSLLLGRQTCIEVLFLITKRTYNQLEGIYAQLPKDCCLYYWETQILSHTNLHTDLLLLQVKKGKHNTIGEFLSYCNMPPKSEEIAIATLKKLMLCSYLANIQGKEITCDLLRQENSDALCKRIEAESGIQFLQEELKLSPVQQEKATP